MKRRISLPEDIKRIASLDYFKNHKDSPYSLREHNRLLSTYIESGKNIYLSGNVLIRYEEDSKDTIVFHAVNGGNTNDLVTAVSAFLDFAAINYKGAVAFYKNSKINKLPVLGIYFYTIEEVQQDDDDLYKLQFDLTRVIK